jgi:hypothetical protein
MDDMVKGSFRTLVLKVTDIMPDDSLSPYGIRRGWRELSSSPQLLQARLLFLHVSH